MATGRWLSKAPRTRAHGSTALLILMRAVELEADQLESAHLAYSQQQTTTRCSRGHGIVRQADAGAEHCCLCVGRVGRHDLQRKDCMRSNMNSIPPAWSAAD